MATAAAHPVPTRPAYDAYRFGNGTRPALQPGTLGWSASDLDDPTVAELWSQGRYEILDGVLTVMPAAYFDGGACADNLKFILRPYLRTLGLRSAFASEVDIRVRPDRVTRADAVCVFGDDLPKFRALRFPPPRTTWRRNVLTLPPSLVIESVSQGHESHDRLTKRQWYGGLGVRRYWIVDAFAQVLDCLLLDGDGYAADGTGQGTDTVRPASLDGLAIPLAEVWDTDEGD